MNWVEAIGIFATLLILISFAQSDTLKLRIINLVGSIIFVVYGLKIGALSVWLLNGICVFVNLYRILEVKQQRRKGLIVIGYQGIGKSTLAKSDPRFVDLESSNFFNGNDRIDDWYVYYCQIAMHLAAQGKIVLVSSHEVVRKQLGATPVNRNVEIVTCTPSLLLEADWVEKLRRRHDETHLVKDFKAYMNAANNYHNNIRDIAMDVFPNIEIKHMNYDLAKLILKYYKEIA